MACPVVRDDPFAVRLLFDANVARELGGKLIVAIPPIVVLTGFDHVLLPELVGQGSGVQIALILQVHAKGVILGLVGNRVRDGAHRGHQGINHGDHRGDDLPHHRNQADGEHDHCGDDGGDHASQRGVELQTSKGAIASFGPHGDEHAHRHRDGDHRQDNAGLHLRAADAPFTGPHLAGQAGHTFSSFYRYISRFFNASKGVNQVNGGGDHRHASGDGFQGRFSAVAGGNGKAQGSYGQPCLCHTTKAFVAQSTLLDPDFGTDIALLTSNVFIKLKTPSF